MDRGLARGLVGVVACVGCGRVDFDTIARDAPVPVDAAPAAGPFGAPLELSVLDAIGGDDPALTSDELEIMFTSEATPSVGLCDVWTSTRADPTAAWAPAVDVGPPLDTTTCDSGAVLSGDGLTVWLATHVGVGFDLFEVHRATRTSPWQTPVPLTSLESAVDDNAPTVSGDERTMVFESNRSGAPLLYLTTRASTTAAWDPPALVGPLTTGTQERSPHVSRDGTRLWFISNALGTDDIWVATRPDLASSFGNATVLTELASMENEDDPWLSDDEHRIYFARYPATGNPTLWTAAR